MSCKRLAPTANDGKINTKLPINIEKHFLLIGTIERYDQYLLLLKKLLKWDYKDICYPHIKLNQSNPKKIKIEKYKKIFWNS